MDRSDIDAMRKLAQLDRQRRTLKRGVEQQDSAFRPAIDYFRLDAERAPAPAAPPVGKWFTQTKI